MPRTTLPKTPKGLASVPGQRRLDAQTLSMIVALASEFTVLRARLDTVERLLAGEGILPPGAIDSYDPDATAQQEREALRQHGLHKIFRALIESGEADLASLDNQTPMEKQA